MNLRTKKKFQFNILFIIIYLVFLFSFPFLRNYFNSNNIRVGAPETVLVAANNSTNFVSKVFNNFFGYFTNKKYLLSEISRLENELQTEKNRKIFEENISSEKKIVAKKIFSDFTSVYNTILLDKGKDNGVAEGNIVFLYPNKAIGVVNSSSEKTSLVSLFSKDKNQVEGIIFSQNFESKIPLINSEEDLNLNASSSSTTIATSSDISQPFSDDINISMSTPVSSSNSILIDFIGYGGGDFVAKIPENINISTGTIVYLARDENKTLGEIVKIEKQEAAFYQILFVKGYYNTRENGDYYIDIQ
ncbi:hypothetical protein SDC9_07759 [bioreactor metagenome]|uniref:Rod shape-determining protein MreC beta-barrel core domain-containing protein n=1 Tax=bioreactor metagenome TaxID=1076179 RepID=A0A644T5E3_9ZZZZ|nr:rod shape-determining protein MreC [Candidatus Elulimicrobiales bacterium]